MINVMTFHLVAVSKLKMVKSAEGVSCLSIVRLSRLVIHMMDILLRFSVQESRNLDKNAVF